MSAAQPSRAAGTARYAALVAVVAVSLTACTATTNGRPHTVAPPTAVEAVPLTALLEAPPAGSHPWGTSWSDDVTPTVDDFVARVYAQGDQAAEAARLDAQGIVDIAHRTWIAADSHQGDVVLLRFATATDAQLRMRTAVAAKSRVADVVSFDIAGQPDAVGLYPSAIDDNGDYRAIVYARKGDVAVELFYYCPEPFDATDATSWIDAQLALLPG